MYQNNSFESQKSQLVPSFSAMFRALTLFLFGFLSLALAGCSPPANGSSEHGAKPAASFKFAGQHPIQIVCTTGMVADLARNVGGQHVKVKALMGAGVDPHLYKASP